MLFRLSVNSAVLALALACSAIEASSQLVPTKWSQIGNGIISPDAEEPEGNHHQSGRARQATWRYDGRQKQDILWIGTSHGGLWKSKVKNRNIVQWVTLTDNFPGPHTLGAFVVNKTNSDKILIGTGDYWGAGDGRMYRTQNQGSAWDAVELLQSNRDKAEVPTTAWRMAEDVTYRSGDTILVATNKGIFRTLDFGLSWSRVFKGFGDKADNVTDIVQDPQQPAVWYAADADFANIIIRSTDHGANWARYAPGKGLISGSVQRVSLTICATNHSVLYALVIDDFGGMNGVYRSLDKAQNWTKIYNSNEFTTTQGDHTCSIACDPENQDHLIFGNKFPIETFSGTTMSLGSAWPEPFDGGHGDYNCILFRPEGLPIVLANDGGYYLYDRGNSDHPLDDSGNLLGINALELAHGPRTRMFQGGFASSYSDPDTFLAGLQDNGVIRGDVSSGSVYLSARGDGGQVSIAPALPSVMAASNTFGKRLVSFDSGTTWQGVNSGISDADPDDPSVNFAAMLIDPTPGLLFPKLFTNIKNIEDSSQVLFRDTLSLSGLWLPVGPAAAQGAISHIEHTTNPFIHEIPFTTADSASLFAYIGPRSFIGNFGLSLVDITPPLSYPLVNPSAYVNADKSRFEQDTIYYTSGVGRPQMAFVSRDGGSTWKDVTGNLSDKNSPDLYKLVGNPFDHKELFLATSSGVYRTANSGQTWIQFSGGLRKSEIVTDIIINSDDVTKPITLYIATEGRGFWGRILGKDR